MTSALSKEDQTVVPSRRWLLLINVQIVTLMYGMAITSATIVLPHIQGALSVNQDQASWTMTLFLVGSAITMPITGWLAGRLGWRRLMVGTLIGFTLSSIACGTATNLETLLLARTAQGVFGAPLMPLGQGMLLATFPKRLHAVALMLWGIGGTMGPVLGPILGGVVGETLGWRWTFIFL
ncbi:MAG: MFS transporter, partial [Burkholderiales bacterium]|nr:MFS transporter [Burkholderiales bacterium]